MLLSRQQWQHVILLHILMVNLVVTLLISRCLKLQVSDRCLPEYHLEYYLQWLLTRCQILNKNTFTILGLILLLLGWSLEELGLETSRYDMIMPTVVKAKVNYMFYSVQSALIHCRLFPRGPVNSRKVVPPSFKPFEVGSFITPGTRSVWADLCPRVMVNVESPEVPGCQSVSGGGRFISSTNGHVGESNGVRR